MAGTSIGVAWRDTGEKEKEEKVQGYLGKAFSQFKGRHGIGVVVASALIVGARTIESEQNREREFR